MEQDKERNEKVKQWLWRYREAKVDMKRLESEYKELIEIQESTGAVAYSDLPKGSSAQTDLSSYIEKREEIKKQIEEAKYKCIMIFQEIENAIEHLPDARERRIVSCRYIELNGCHKKSWEEICKITSYEWRQVHYIHSKALKDLYEKIF